jgi:hypothetical protein
MEEAPGDFEPAALGDVQMQTPLVTYTAQVQEQ